MMKSRDTVQDFEGAPHNTIKEVKKRFKGVDFELNTRHLQKIGQTNLDKYS